MAKRYVTVVREQGKEATVVSGNVKSEERYNPILQRTERKEAIPTLPNNQYLQGVIDRAGQTGKITPSEIANNPNAIQQLERKAWGGYERKEVSKQLVEQYTAPYRRDLSSQEIEKEEFALAVRHGAPVPYSSITPKPVQRMVAQIERQKMLRERELKIKQVNAEVEELNKRILIEEPSEELKEKVDIFKNKYSEFSNKYSRAGVIEKQRQREQKKQLAEIKGMENKLNTPEKLTLKEYVGLRMVYPKKVEEFKQFTGQETKQQTKGGAMLRNALLNIDILQKRFSDSRTGKAYGKITDTAFVPIYKISEKVVEEQLKRLPNIAPKTNIQKQVYEAMYGKNIFFPKPYYPKEKIKEANINLITGIHKELKENPVKLAATVILFKGLGAVGELGMPLIKYLPPKAGRIIEKGVGGGLLASYGILTASEISSIKNEQKRNEEIGREITKLGAAVAGLKFYEITKPKLSLGEFEASTEPVTKNVFKKLNEQVDLVSETIQPNKLVRRMDGSILVDEVFYGKTPLKAKILGVTVASTNIPTVRKTSTLIKEKTPSLVDPSGEVILKGASAEITGSEVLFYSPEKVLGRNLEKMTVDIARKPGKKPTTYAQSEYGFSVSEADVSGTEQVRTAMYGDIKSRKISAMRSVDIPLSSNLEKINKLLAPGPSNTILASPQFSEQFFGTIKGKITLSAIDKRLLKMFDISPGQSLPAQKVRSLPDYADRIYTINRLKDIKEEVIPKRIGHDEQAERMFKLDDNLVKVGDKRMSFQDAMYQKYPIKIYIPSETSIFSTDLEVMPERYINPLASDKSFIARKKQEEGSLAMLKRVEVEVNNAAFGRDVRVKELPARFRNALFESKKEGKYRLYQMPEEPKGKKIIKVEKHEQVSKKPDELKTILDEKRRERTVRQQLEMEPQEEITYSKEYLETKQKKSSKQKQMEAEYDLSDFSTRLKSKQASKQKTRLKQMLVTESGTVPDSISINKELSELLNLQKLGKLPLKKPKKGIKELEDTGHLQDSLDKMDNELKTILYKLNNPPREPPFKFNGGGNPFFIDVPNIKIPKIKIPRYPSGFGGVDDSEWNYKPRRKSLSRSYTPDLAGKLLGFSVRVKSKKALRKLLRQEFTGLEIRPVPLLIKKGVIA